VFIKLPVKSTNIDCNYGKHCNWMFLLIPLQRTPSPQYRTAEQFLLVKQICCDETQFTQSRITKGSITCGLLTFRTIPLQLPVLFLVACAKSY